MRTLGEVCERHGVSIDSLQQLPDVDNFVVVTDTVRASAVARVAADLAEMPWAGGKPFWMPIVPA